MFKASMCIIPNIVTIHNHHSTMCDSCNLLNRYRPGLRRVLLLVVEQILDILQTHVPCVDHDEDGEDDSEEAEHGEDPEHCVHAELLVDVGEQLSDDETETPAVAYCHC